ncbi:hypothetical protein F0562_034538 [Nyssa sinensis]|uniref:Integrase catalytic domain-containing protein n=1 Tax=Nyssa sinensis TaxID=561372 RepID=A0A5J5AK27_9ASTE|nr:hypothetical protein F0562_034538 [Nyssa sinensis]
MNISRGLNPVADYLRFIKSIADELALAGALLDNLNLVMHTLNGPGSDFKELAIATRARDSIISFEELYDKLVDYESFLKRAENQSSSITAHATRFNNKSDTTTNYRKGGNHSDQNHSQGPNNFQKTSGKYSNNNSRNFNNNGGKNSVVFYQFCEKRGHTARQCYHVKKILLRDNSNTPTVNHTTTGVGSASNWLMDSVASHHVTIDLSTLSPRQPYEGPDDIVIGDVEIFFHTSIVTLYSDGGGEYQGLKTLVESHGIQNLVSPPHTP